MKLSINLNEFFFFLVFSGFFLNSLLKFLGLQHPKSIVPGVFFSFFLFFFLSPSLM